jgi:hypothetical protein
MKKFALCLFAVTAVFALSLGASASVDVPHHNGGIAGAVENIAEGVSEGINDIAGDNNGNYDFHNNHDNNRMAHDGLLTHEDYSHRNRAAAIHDNTHRHNNNNHDNRGTHHSNRYDNINHNNHDNRNDNINHNNNNHNNNHGAVTPVPHTGSVAEVRGAAVNERDRNPSTGIGFGLIELAAIGTTMIGTAALAGGKRRK